MVETDLDEVIKLIDRILQKKHPPDELSPYLKRYPALEKLANDLLSLCEFAAALANGDLSPTLNLRGYFPGALKALQSNLRHLTWQTTMVAAGDYSQRVDFMGDFSQSFNTMILRLKEATENEQRYITELEKSRAMIAKSERNYRLIAENTEDVIWLMDEEKNIRYISPSVEKLLGYRPEDFTGKAATATPLPFLQAIFQEASTRFAETDDETKPFIIESQQSCKDKKIIWTESLVSAARNNEGSFVGLLGVTRDISERKKNESLLYLAYERRKKADFFNHLAVAKMDNDAEILSSAWQNKLYIPKNFSLFFLVIDNLDTLAEEANQHRKQQIIDTLVDDFSRKENTIAWDTTKGIGILHSRSHGADRKSAEKEVAQEYVRDVSLYFPDLSISLGIANYANGLVSFSSRLQNAEIALKIGKKVWAKQRIYHYDDCGIYQVLAPFAMTGDAGNYIKKTIGPLMEHDKKDGTDLVKTLEKILSGLTFKEIGEQMYLHHKTIQLRKQRIEQILNVSLDSCETRMALSTALQLEKITRE